MRVQASLERLSTKNDSLIEMRDRMLRHLVGNADSSGLEYVVFKTVNSTGTAGVDIDLMIRPDDFESGIRMLQAIGFYPIDSLAKKYATGFMMRGNPLVLDLHTKLAVLGVEYMSSSILLAHKRDVIIDGADGNGELRVPCLDGAAESVVRAAHSVIKESRITVGDMYEVMRSAKGAATATQQLIIDTNMQFVSHVFNEVSSFATGSSWLPSEKSAEFSVGEGIADSFLRRELPLLRLPFEIPLTASALILFLQAKKNKRAGAAFYNLANALTYRRNASIIGRKVTHFF